MDHPGFGLSEGLHGYVPSFDALVDNVIEIYTKIKGMIHDNSWPFFIITIVIKVGTSYLARFSRLMHLVKK